MLLVCCSRLAVAAGAVPPGPGRVLVSCSAALSGSKHTRLKKVYDLDRTKQWIQKLSPEDKEYLREALDPPKQHRKSGITAARPASNGHASKSVVKESTSESVPRPSNRELRQLAMHASLPFIGFGFLDNFIMILAGDYIDHHIGVTLGISTMAAAALGNTISDVCGVGSAYYVEFLAAKLGASPPDLTVDQMNLTVARVSSNVGRAVGVTLGCVIGMAPLMFT